MREIKFRAWNKREKKMVDVHTIDFCNGNINANDSDNYDDIVLGFDSILMQYTGIKDKNKTEIYEGDIVEAWSEGVKGVGYIKKRNDGLWFIYPSYQKKLMWYLKPDENDYDNVTVLGNIYENPELLKE